MPRVDARPEALFEVPSDFAPPSETGGGGGGGGARRKRRAFFEVAIAGEPAGRIVFELDSSVAPRTVSGAAGVVRLQLRYCRGGAPCH